MPRPRQSHGRPGTQVFPDNWQAEHAQVIATTFDSVIKIGTAGPPAWNSTRNQTETAIVAPVYDGPAAIGPISTSDGRQLEVVDELTHPRSYEISLEVGAAGLKPGQRVLVDESPDTMLPAGSLLIVDSVERSSRRFSRVLYATLDG